MQNPTNDNRRARPDGLIAVGAFAATLPMTSIALDCCWWPWAVSSASRCSRQSPWKAGPQPWLALAFLAVVTQFGAFWFWYRAMATGVARTSQLQLLQPFLTLLLSAALLGESVPPELWLYAATVVVTIHFARASSRQGWLPAEESNR